MPALPPLPTAGTADTGTACRALSYDAGVLRHLVHRNAISEILVTDWYQTGPDTFHCGAQWPRRHAFYTSIENQHDPLLIPETIRQVGILLPHVAYGVPHGHRFLMDELSYAAEPDALNTHPYPTDLLLEVEISRVQRRPKGIRGLRLDLTFTHERICIAQASGTVRIVAPQHYSRIRWGDREPSAGPVQMPPADAASVGRLDPDDVVLGPQINPGEWLLRAPLTHPVLFDHPVDHLPGMLLFEAVRQAGRAVLGRPRAQPIRCDASFERFVDPGRTSTIRLDVVDTSPSNGTATVRAEVEQAGRTAALITATMTTPEHARQRSAPMA